MRLAPLVAPLLLVIACQGASPAPAQPTPSGPPPAVCPSVTFSCTMPGLGCVEGGADFAAQMRAECGGDSTAADGPCPREGGLGACTMYEGLAPKLHACATLVFAGGSVADAATAQGKCDQFKGTYTAP
ncbi:MAG: hypothetical protein IPH44_27330 [Myxococcales bacterium]|nr:hypothetical protein [Myxococcales bacterium]